MTQEDRQLLIRDLCARLPYGVKINIRNDYTLTMEDMELSAYHLATASYDVEYRNLRPYLRPMSSMTEEERRDFAYYVAHGNNSVALDFVDWCNANHFDHRCLIGKGLALEAPEGMYKNE